MLSPLYLRLSIYQRIYQRGVIPFSLQHRSKRSIVKEKPLVSSGHTLAMNKAFSKPKDREEESKKNAIRCPQRTKAIAQQTTAFPPPACKFPSPKVRYIKHSA
jgi:hypothetical protein